MLTLLLALTIVLSVSAIAASDVNVTDSYATDLVDDTSGMSVDEQSTVDSSISAVEQSNADSNMSVSSDSNMDIDDSSKVSLSSEEVLESDNSNTLSTNTVKDTSLSSTNENQEILAAKKVTQIVPFKNIYYGYPVKVVLKDANGKAISGKKVTITVGGKSYTKTTNDNGVAAVKTNLYTGKYTATAKFAGDSSYASQQLTYTFNILATIKSKAIAKYYKGSTQYSATFLNGNGKALADTYVHIIVNGKTYNRKTNANGIAYMAINLKPGTYKITSTDPVTGYKLTNTFKVLSTIETNDISKVYTDGKQFFAKFHKEDGSPLSGQRIKFTLDGTDYYVTTNSKGGASLNLRNLDAGTHKITTTNTNDGLHNVNTIKVVNHCKSKLIASAYTFLTSDAAKVISVTLHNEFNYAPGAGKTITFVVRDRTYSATTDSKGVASIRLPSSLDKGVYVVKYSYAGNSFYSASSASSKVVVIPSKNPTFTIKSSTNFLQGASSNFKVALTGNGVPLEKRVITFKIDGKSVYTTTTNSKGIASLPIKNLAAGSHKVTFTNNAEPKVNSKTSTTTISVIKRSATSIYWKTGTTMNEGSNIVKVLLQDSSKKPLSGKEIKVTVNSKEYTKKTDYQGYAKFKIAFAKGTASVSYKFAGDNFYTPSGKSLKVKVLKEIDNPYGFWVNGADMKKVNLNTLASRGTTDLFLNYYAIQKHGKSSVENWIASANKYGMRVHIWMQVFNNGKWINPVKNGDANMAYFNQKLSEAMSYAKLKGVSGVHFDYLRYPGTAYKTNGGTQAITKFVKLAESRLHNTNSNLIISAALMPETTSNAYYYGQDYSQISKYMDVVIPMVYKGNYGKTSSWITSTTKWFVSNSKGAEVWAGLQSYKSDDDTSLLAGSVLRNDIKAALNAKAPGVILFRYGLSCGVNFKTIPVPDLSKGPSALSIINIIGGAYLIKSYYDKNNKLPTTVTVAKHAYTMPEFLYLMEKAVYQLGNSNTNPIKCIYGVKAPTKPTGDSIGTASLSKSGYMKLAKNVADSIVKNNRAPNYGNSAVGKVIYSELIDSASRILNYYKNQKVMPNSVAIKYSTASVPAGGLNVKNTIKNLAPYRVATTNCQVGNTAIKNLVKSITSGITDDVKKATAIFNYVRDSISYSFYYDTHQGALGTYNAKSGNCVDQAHLLVAMFRTAGFAARYEHGTCTFTLSGSTYGHVWAQVLIGDVWVVSDPTSTRNSFGKVVNWNTGSYSHHAYYASLPF